MATPFKNLKTGNPLTTSSAEYVKNYFDDQSGDKSDSNIQKIDAALADSLHLETTTTEPTEATNYLWMNPLNGQHTQTDGDWHVEDSAGGLVADCTISGNGWQSKQGKNLCPRPTVGTYTSSGITYTTTENGTITLKGTSTAISELVISFPKAMENGNYILSNSNTTTVINDGCYSQLQVNGDYPASGYHANFASINSTRTFTVDAGHVITGMRIRIAGGVTLDNFVIKLQIEVGSTATPYEPYTPDPTPEAPITPVCLPQGTEIKVVGENWFDPVVYSSLYNPVSGYFEATAAVFANVQLSVPEILQHKQFTFTAYVKGASTNIRVAIRYTDATVTIGNNVNSIDEFIRTTVISNPEKTISYIWLGYGSGRNFTVYAKDIQINLGSVATPYEPYTNPTTLTVPCDLWKVVNADKWDIINGKAVNNTAQVLLNGTGLTWSPNTALTDVAVFSAPAALANSLPVDSVKILCDKFYVSHYNDVSNTEHIRNSSANFSTSLVLYIAKSRLTGWSDEWTLTQKREALNTWLAANPVTVRYELATPIETQYPPQPITLPQGVVNMVVESSNGVLPSEVDISYLRENDGTYTDSISTIITKNKEGNVIKHFPSIKPDSMFGWSESEKQSGRQITESVKLFTSQEVPVDNKASYINIKSGFDTSSYDEEVSSFISRDINGNEKAHYFMTKPQCIMSGTEEEKKLARDNLGSEGLIKNASTKATIVDADYIPLVDSADSNKTKISLWSNIKSVLKTYFDGIYPLKTTLGMANGIATLNSDGKLAQMPNAPDVGARPDDWMPTLSEVGGNRSNLLDNGDFQNPINQRGFTEETASGKYTLDRWKTELSLPDAGNIIYDNANKCLIIRRTGSDKTILVRQNFEVPLLENTTVTITIKLQDGSIYSTTLIPTDVSQTRDLDTSKALRVYIFRQSFAIVNYNPAIANADIAIQWVKMEYGTTSTPFYPKINVDEELRKCQRFYENSWYPLSKTAYNEMFAHIFASTQADVRVEFKTTKRAPPNMAFYPRGEATDWQIYNGTYYNVGDKQNNGRGACNAGIIRLTKDVNDTSTWTPGNTIQAHGHWEADANL